MPAYLSLGGHEGGPIRPHLVLVPLQLLTNIDNLLADPSNGLYPGVELSLSLASLTIPAASYIYLTSDSALSLAFPPSLSFALSLFLRSLGPPQQGMEPPLHIHRHQFPIPPDLRGVPLCIQFTYLGLVYGGVDLGLKFGPCPLQFVSHPLLEGPIIPPPNPLHPLPCPLSPKYKLPPIPSLSLYSKSCLFLPPHLLVNCRTFLQRRFYIS